MLLELLQSATLPGQLYALLGLREERYRGLEELLKTYRERADEVEVRAGCLGGWLPVRDVIARISGRLSASAEGSLRVLKK